MSQHIPKDDSGIGIRNTRPEICHNCGTKLKPGQGYRVEEWDYPWDGSDTEGSITELMVTWYEEPVGVECMKRCAANGHNLEFLRDFATGKRKAGHEPFAKEWRDIARSAYNAHVKGDRELADMIARGEEGAMREAGWGGIGGSQGRGE